MVRTFTCEMCLETFETSVDWTEENALAEAEENFPALTLADRARVCDECYEKLIEFRDA